jgi:hypothetical protein
MNAHCFAPSGAGCGDTSLHQHEYFEIAKATSQAPAPQVDSKYHLATSSIAVSITPLSLIV